MLAEGHVILGCKLAQLVSRIALYPANLFGSFKSQDGPSPCLCVSMCELSVSRREGRHLFCQPYIQFMWIFQLKLAVKTLSHYPTKLSEEGFVRFVFEVGKDLTCLLFVRSQDTRKAQALTPKNQIDFDTILTLMPFPRPLPIKFRTFLYCQKALVIVLK